MSIEQRSSSDAPQEKWGAADDRVAAPKPRSRRWGLRVALGVLAGYVLMSMTITWSHWGKFDPANGSQERDRAGVPLSPEEHPWYYPILLLHVMCASVALITCVFQIWPWLRRTHPRIHLNIGRFYAFAGVIPAAILALVTQVFWPFSAVTAFSQVVMALLWLSVTTYGVVLLRRGRTADHRRWMLRSFALTISDLVIIFIDPLVELIISTQLYTRLAGSMDIFMQVRAANENWLALTICLVAVEWKLERERVRDVDVGH